MIAEKYCQNASEVRKKWSMTIDSAVHERPVFINRTHDRVAMMDSRLLENLLMDYKYHVTMETEDDGSITGFVEELQLAENAATKEECLKEVISAMKDYAADFYSQFGYWSKAPNRVSHIPYILKLILSDDEKVAEDIICQDGRN